MSNEEKELLDELSELFTKDPKELQKKYQNEAYEKYFDKFRPYIHLWNLTDKEWVRRRKEVWGKIVEREKQEDKNFVKSYWEEAERFFLRAKPRKSDNELYTYRIMAYTPFQSIDDIVELYLKEHVSLRHNLHENLLTYASSFYRAVPEEFHRVQLIAEALYTRDYVAKMEKMGHDQSPDFVVYYPRDFIKCYSSGVRNYIKMSSADYLKNLKDIHNQHYTGHERSFVEVTFDFFLGSLEYAMSDNAKEFTGTINDRGIKGIKEICTLIESYEPDIQDEFRDNFIEKSRNYILSNENVNKIRSMSE